MQIDRIDPAFGHWFAGLVDGEGCFLIQRFAPDPPKNPYGRCSCAFTLTLRADDADLLRQVQAELGIGTLQRCPSHRPSQQPTVRFQIAAKADTLQLVAFFDRFPLRSKKARDLEVWRRAISEWQLYRVGPKGTARRDWAPMHALHQELIDTRKYIPEQELAHG